MLLRIAGAAGIHPSKLKLLDKKNRRMAYCRRTMKANCTCVKCEKTWESIVATQARENQCRESDEAQRTCACCNRLLTLSGHAGVLWRTVGLASSDAQAPSGAGPRVVVRLGFFVSWVVCTVCRQESLAKKDARSAACGSNSQTLLAYPLGLRRTMPPKGAIDTLRRDVDYLVQALRVVLLNFPILDPMWDRCRWRFGFLWVRDCLRLS